MPLATTRQGSLHYEIVDRAAPARGTREAILFGEAARLPAKPSDAVLARELTAAWLAYLGAPPPGRT